MQEQLIAANQAEAEKSERIRELEEEVANLKEQLAAAHAKPADGEPEGELPVQSLENPTESEQVPSTPISKKALRKASVSTKAKGKSKASMRGGKTNLDNFLSKIDSSRIRRRSREYPQMLHFFLIRRVLVTLIFNIIKTLIRSFLFL